MDTAPRAGIEPLHVPMSLDLKPSPDPSRNRGGPLAHIRVVTSTPLSMGAVVPEPCLACPPKNCLGRCARTLWGPALEQEALAGMPPKKFLGRCARKLWGPAGAGSPCRGASQKTLSDAALGSSGAQHWNRKPLQGCLPKNSLGRCARKLWGPALEQGSLEGCVRKNASGCCARKLAFAGGSLHAEASNASRFPNECSPLAAHFLTRKLTSPNGLRIKRIRLPIADWRLRNVIRTQKDGNYPEFFRICVFSLFFVP